MKSKKPSLTPQNNTGAVTVNGETSPVSVGLLSLHTTQSEASKNLEKKRKFSEVEGTQGQVILGQYNGFINFKQDFRRSEKGTRKWDC